MSTVNLATSTVDELRAYAANELNLTISKTITTQDTIVKKILEQCAKLNIDPPESSIGDAKVIDKATGEKEKRLILLIPATKEDKYPAFVGVQGVGWLIPRNVEVVVPARVVEVLKNAKQDIFTQNPETREMLKSTVPTYAYSILGEAPDDYVAPKSVAA